MNTKDSILSQIVPDEDIPVLLKGAILSEIDTVRSSIVVVNHFTENLVKSIATCMSLVTEN